LPVIQDSDDSSAGEPWRVSSSARGDFEMSMRTNRKTVTFNRPFAVIGRNALQPAGTYMVETDAELFDGVTLPTSRRIGTSIFLPARPPKPGWAEVAQIDPRELEAATNGS
jgi:hypothetical protein